MFPVNIIGETGPSDHEIDLRLPGDGETTTWRIAEETPTALVYNQRNYAVMLATPQDLVDFAIGFSFSERIVAGIEDIRSLDISSTDYGVDLRIAVSDDCIARFDARQRRRNLPGIAGCGVCGVESVAEMFAPTPKLTGGPKAISAAAVSRAIEELSDHQPLNQRTRSVHAAAWARLEGGVALAREDVGRHNALDKLIGALLREGIDPLTGFIVMSSRCSYELVEKAAQFGAAAVASISAPTSFAVRRAKDANVAVYSRTKGGVVTVVERR